MILVRVDGNRQRIPTRSGETATREELTELMGGGWRISATVWLAQSASHAYLLESIADALPVNEAASRMAGRVVWGDALLVERGREMR